MPGACVSLWPTDECKWSIAAIWHWSDLVERAIYISLALMLGYTFFVLVRFLRRDLLARLEARDLKPDSTLDFFPQKKNLVADLSRGLGTLKAIGSTAPLLGLAGTSYLILDLLSRGISMSKGYALFYLINGTASALISAVGGIVVAIPAVLIQNVLRTSVEGMQRELSVAATSQDRFERPFRRAQALPLRQRFSGLPPFALLAAPTLACALMVFIGVSPYPRPTGLPVTVAQDHCAPGLVDRALVLRVTAEGKLFLNYEPEDSNGLPQRLSQIYRMRADRVLYFQADDELPFQTVADAIDIARNPTTSAGSLHITVRLITPQTEVENALCHAPVWRGSSGGKK